MAKAGERRGSRSIRGRSWLLVTACANEDPKRERHFFRSPSTIRIHLLRRKDSGGFIKREGAHVGEGDSGPPASLTARYAPFPEDSPAKPRSSPWWSRPTPEQDPDKTGQSRRWGPWRFPISRFEHVLGAVRVGMVNGVLIATPLTPSRVSRFSTIVVAGTEGHVMVEAGASQVSEGAGFWKPSSSGTTVAAKSPAPSSRWLPPAARPSALHPPPVNQDLYKLVSAKAKPDLKDRSTPEVSQTAELRQDRRSEEAHHRGPAEEQRRPKRERFSIF